MQPSWLGRQVQLRVLTPEDRQTLVHFDREATRNGGSNAGYRHWAAHRAASGAGDDDARLAIETRAERQLVGSLCTTPTQPQDQQFSYGIGIGPAHRGRGYAADALGALLAFMFGDRHYHLCEVSIYADNHSSLRLHRKLGFHEVGRGRDTEHPIQPAPCLVRMTLGAAEFLATHRPH
ncbi:GNAT family N-acetyltransferase [Bounagaea algeriensis]